METIKAYTDLPQSKKLLKILPIDSADLHIIVEDFVDEDTGDIFNVEKIELGRPCNESIPCWSLAALFDVLPNNESRNTDLSKGRYDTQNKKYIDDWNVSYNEENGKNYFVTHADNPVDACVEMILKLHEFKLI